MSGLRLLKKTQGDLSFIMSSELAKIKYNALSKSLNEIAEGLFCSKMCPDFLS
jgi:hypothetical protein